MIKEMIDQWRRLDAEYAAAHQEYLRMTPGSEPGVACTTPGAGDFDARLVAKSNLARAQRAMRDFSQKHIDLLVGVREA